MEAYSGNEDIAPLILNLRPRWSLVVSLSPRPLYTQGKSRQYPLNRRLGGLMWHFECSENLDKSLTPTRIRTSDLSAHRLYGPCFPSSTAYFSLKKEQRFIRLLCSLCACWILGLTFQPVMYLCCT